MTYYDTNIISPYPLGSAGVLYPSVSFFLLLLSSPWSFHVRRRPPPPAFPCGVIRDLTPKEGPVFLLRPGIPRGLPRCISNPKERTASVLQAASSVLLSVSRQKKGPWFFRDHIMRLPYSACHAFSAIHTLPSNHCVCRFCAFSGALFASQNIRKLATKRLDKKGSAA